jgi:molybdopterin molybdotransferase
MATKHDCCGPATDDRHTLTKQEAIDFLLSRVQPIADTETVPTGEGLGRVLATPVSSAIAVPGWDNKPAKQFQALCDAGAQVRGGDELVPRQTPRAVSG